MVKDKQIVEVGFKLVGIKTEQFAIFEENHIVGEDVAIATNLSFSLNKTDKILRATSNFTYEMKAKPIIKIGVNCSFQISDGLWEQSRTEESFVFAKNSVIHMSMLTISTVRGVLHAMTAGTPFNKYFLPTVNVTKLIPEDVRFT